MKKRFTVMLLVLSMVISSLAGCKSSPTTGGQSEKPTQAQTTTAPTNSSESGEKEAIAVDAFAGTTLKIAVYKHTMDKSEDFNEKPAFKAAEEATGIHIEWIYVDSGSQEEKVNIMLTSDMPDAIFGLLTQKQVSTNMDSFYDLSQEGLLETYAPNVVADYLTMDSGMGAVTWPDGSIRTLMTGRQVSYVNSADGIMVINKAWLDQLGLSIPTTAEEFYNVLCAFRDNDMNGNGDPTDEIPLEISESNWAAKVMNLANPWGIAGYAANNESAFLKVEDGQVKGTVNTQEFRSFLEYYNKLAKEGLLDVEGFSQTNEQYYAKLKEGVVGCYFAWTPYSNMSAEEAANWVVLPPFQAIEGVTPVKTGEKNRLQADRCGFAISSESKNVEAILTWWNYLSSSTEMKYTVRFGEQGGKWNIVDGKVMTQLPDEVTDEFNETNYEYTYGMVDRGPFIRIDEEVTVMENPTDPTYIRELMVDQVADYLATEYLPTKFADSEKINERSFIEIELFSEINNFVATSIVEGLTDESWNKYIAKLDTLQYGAWIDWYQKFYNGEY